MRKLDWHFSRGLIMAVFGIAGAGFELLFSESCELFLVVLYLIVLASGLILLFSGTKNTN